MTTKRKRGRPKTAATIERERQEETFARIFEVAGQNVSQEELAETQALAKSLEQGRRDLLASFKSPPFPERLVFAELSIEPDPALEGAPPNTAKFRAYRESVIREAEEVRSDIASGRRRGSENAAKLRNSRIEYFADANRVLLGRLGKPGYSTRQVTDRVMQDWHNLDPIRRLAGEPKSLARRGDGQAPPKPETLRQSWLPKAKKRLGI
ncbi:MAG: hypothetical protein RL753_12 [Bacteroidota bacterium]